MKNLARVLLITYLSFNLAFTPQRAWADQVKDEDIPPVNDPVKKQSPSPIRTGDVYTAGKCEAVCEVYHSFMGETGTDRKSEEDIKKTMQDLKISTATTDDEKNRASANAKTLKALCGVDPKDPAFKDQQKGGEIENNGRVFANYEDCKQFMINQWAQVGPICDGIKLTKKAIYNETITASMFTAVAGICWGAAITSAATLGIGAPIMQAACTTADLAASGTDIGLNIKMEQDGAKKEEVWNTYWAGKLEGYGYAGMANIGGTAVLGGGAGLATRSLYARNVAKKAGEKAYGEASEQASKKAFDLAYKKAMQESLEESAEKAGNLSGRALTRAANKADAAAKAAGKMAARKAGFEAGEEAAKKAAQEAGKEAAKQGGKKALGSILMAVAAALASVTAGIKWAMKVKLDEYQKGLCDQVSASQGFGDAVLLGGGGGDEDKDSTGNGPGGKGPKGNFSAANLKGNKDGSGKEDSDLDSTFPPPNSPGSQSFGATAGGLLDSIDKSKVPDALKELGTSLSDIKKRLETSSPASVVSALVPNMPSGLADALKEQEEMIKAGKIEIPGLEGAVPIAGGGPGGSGGSGAGSTEPVFGMRKTAGITGAGTTSEIGFEKAAPKTLPTDGDVFHGAWNGTIFQIISLKLNSTRERVDSMEYQTPLNRALIGLPPLKPEAGGIKK